MARRTTACFDLNRICCVTINVETHVASLKTYEGVWLCGSVVHQHFRFLDGVGGGQSLLGDDFVEHNKHGVIDGAWDIDERSGDALHAHDAAFSIFGAVVESGEYWTLESYVGAIHLWGEYWVRLGTEC